MGEDATVTVDRAWTPANHTVLDFIGHQLWENQYKKIVKKRNTWKNELSTSMLLNAHGLIGYNDEKIPDELKQYVGKYLEYKKFRNESSEIAEFLFKNEHDLDDPSRKKYNKRCHYTLKIADKLREEIGMNRIDQLEAIDLGNYKYIGYSTIELKIKKLKERYNSFFRKRRAEYLLDLIKRTSEARFTMQYPLRVPITREHKSQENTVTKISDVRLENVMINNDTFFNLKIRNDKILVSFDTLLGRAYVHNLLTLNTDWFEENYLKLDGLASAIYRRFFVIKSGNKFNELPIKDLVDFFGLIENSRYPVLIESAFKDIKNAGLIDDYKFIVNGGKFSKGYIEVIKSSK